MRGWEEASGDRNYFQSTLLGIAGLLACLVAAALVEPSLIGKLQGIIIPGTQNTFDVGHYLNLAVNPKCWVFYPLWPGIIRSISNHTDFEPAQAAIGASILLFTVSLFLGNIWLRRNASSSSDFRAIWILLVLSPMNVFMINGYSEPLFATLSWLLIISTSEFFKPLQDEALQGDKTKKILITLSLALISSILIGYCRPSLPQIVAACAATTAIQGMYAKSFRGIFKSKTFLLNLVILAGCAIGYSIYGMQCINEGFSFFQPFASQSKDWDKSLGIRPWFLFTSRSPIYDLWGLYYPTALLILGGSQIIPHVKSITSILSYRKPWFAPLFLTYPPIAISSAAIINAYRFIHNKAKVISSAHLSCENESTFNSEKVRYIFFYTATFSASHSLIVFLTQENYLYSLGRYIFGQPYFYAALALYLPAIRSQLGRQSNRLFLSCWIVSGLLLFNQIVEYGRNAWVG